MAIFLILALILLISQTVETVSGFGGSVIALTVGIHFLPLELLVPVLVILNLFISSSIVFRHHRHINRALLLHEILPKMGLGLAIGIWIFSTMETPILRTLLGGLVLVLSLVELVRMRWPSKTDRQLPNWQKTTYLVGAGVMHGIYASGGPLLVYFTSRLKLSKTVFRSTLSMVWLVLNLFMLLSHLSTNRITPNVLKLGVLLLPVIPLGFILGEWLHHRVQERSFIALVYILLMGAGLSLLIL